MSEKCNEGSGRACDKEATYTVERRDLLLSHRKLFLCAEHAEKYKKYPSDFIVAEIESAR